MSEFQRELEQSLYLHRALPLHREREYEARFYDKKVLAQKPVNAEAAVEGAELSVKDGAYTVTAPLRCEPWPKADPGAVDYRNFGTARLSFSFPAESWEGYNRLRFSVKPHILGGRICHLNLAVFSDGKNSVPDRYFREGATVFDLTNGEWNDCIWEFNAMDRDAVHRLEFYVFRAGHDVGAGEDLTYIFKDIRLEQVEAPEHEHGWENPMPGIRLSSVGYFPKGAKTAIATTDAQKFSVVKLPEQQTVFTAKIEQIENARGHFWAVLSLRRRTRFLPPVYRAHGRHGRLRACRHGEPRQRRPPLLAAEQQRHLPRDLDRLFLPVFAALRRDVNLALADG